jgi:hypothetical protein
VGLTTQYSKKLIVTKVDTTSQSSQRAVVPMEEEEEECKYHDYTIYSSCSVYE